MKDEKETRQRLLQSALEEFMEKGYNHASLRSICKKVGVTTGALYFFFQDKEDLFASLVEEPVEKLYKIMEQHYTEEQKRGLIFDGTWDIREDITVAQQVVRYLYTYRDIFLLVLTKSEGSRFETCKDRFVDITERHYLHLVENLGKGNAKIPDPYLVHWLAHMHIDIFVHMLTHEPDSDKAVKRIEEIVNYLMKGWQGLF